ncbi:hypothetical protein [Planctomicrobium sp. SH664]|uniref:hypothetical protein n=1 Tax=Planctomicrobium sp. SH664 TaxID=3448125 RepID=UPI003F5C2AE1
MNQVRLAAGQFLLWGLLALCLSGCGGEKLKFYDVHGSVTLDGKPVRYAEMHIDPSSEDANSGRTVHVKVINGQYTAPFKVAGGPAKWNIAVVDVDSLGIKDPDNMTPMEDEKFLRAKKLTFEKEIAVEQEEINLEL